MTVKADVEQALAVLRDHVQKLESVPRDLHINLEHAVANVEHHLGQLVHHSAPAPVEEPVAEPAPAEPAPEPVAEPVADEKPPAKVVEVGTATEQSDESK